MPTFAPMPSELETERLQLRIWETSDAANIRLLWTERDPRSLRLIDADGRPTVADLAAEIEAQLAVAAHTGLVLMAIEHRSTGRFLGYCGLITGRATSEEPEIAFELFRQFHGHGYATEAARAVVEAASATGRTRLWATVRAWNLASLRVLDHLGFVRTDRVTTDPVRGDLLWLTRSLPSAAP